ncbi:PAS domain S-box protein [bacterium]|nr:PAS domain S-box protein [bacterium]
MEKARILIVEDESIIAIATQDILQRHGYQVIQIVDTGDKALEVTKNEKPDIILMDIHIRGEMDGIATAERIRKQFEIPIIFLTAYLDEKRLEKVKLTMPFGYLLKPIQERDLHVTIEMALHVSKVDAERKKVETSLRNIVEHSTNLFYTHTTDHLLTYVSPQCQDMLGYDPEEIKVKWVELASDHPINKIGLVITQKAIETGVRQPAYELELIHKNGNKVWLEIRESPIVVDGKTVSIVGSATDITGQKKVVQSLKEAESNYRSFIDTSPVAIVVVRDMKVIYANQMAVQKSEYRKDEIINLTFVDLIAPFDLNEAISKWSRREENTNPERSFEISIVSKSQKIILVKLFYVEVIWEGEPAYLYFLNDITESKHAEKALKESEEKFRTVVEHMNEGLTINDAHFELIYVNRMICETLGYSEKELIGHPVTSLFTEESLGLLYMHHEKVKKGEVSSCEVEVIKKDGGQLSVLLSSTPILENGIFSKSVAIFTDISHLKQYERLLEQEVRERTKELTIAKDKAEQANRLKSEFLANISHELRTPMHSILSYSDFGYKNFDRKDSEKLIGFFKNIYISGSRLLTLLNDLLDLSKLQANKMEYNKNIWNMNSVFEEIKTEFSIWANEKNLSWQIGEIEKANILFDLDKIKQVVSNLFSNAIRYSDKNSVIKVSFEDTEDKFIVTVKNRGILIPTDELESIFDPFVQSSTTKTGAGGTGLGLPICRKIIEDHGGKIWAEEDPNGATIKFFLPKE